MTQMAGVAINSTQSLSPATSHHTQVHEQMVTVARMEVVHWAQQHGLPFTEASLTMVHATPNLPPMIFVFQISIPNIGFFEHTQTHAYTYVICVRALFPKNNN